MLVSLHSGLLDPLVQSSFIGTNYLSSEHSSDDDVCMDGGNNDVAIAAPSSSNQIHYDESSRK